MRVMRVTTIHGPRDIRLEERPEPTIDAPTDAIIKVTAGCICGSDLWPYRGENDITPGDTIGHEMIGVVEEVGSEVTLLLARRLRDRPVLPLRQHLPALLGRVPTPPASTSGFTTGGQGEYAKVTQAEGSLVQDRRHARALDAAVAADTLRRAADRLALRGGRRRQAGRHRRRRR